MLAGALQGSERAQKHRRVKNYCMKIDWSSTLFYNRENQDKKWNAQDDDEERCVFHIYLMSSLNGKEGEERELREKCF
jgi:hypothetical protein